MQLNMSGETIESLLYRENKPVLELKNELNGSGKRLDLPEVLTRDIVSPVKASVEGLDSLIKEIEDDQMDKIIYN